MPGGQTEGRTKLIRLPRRPLFGLPRSPQRMPVCPSHACDWLQEEHGPITEDEYAAALAELDELDAEHQRRRTAGKRDAGEAA